MVAHPVFPQVGEDLFQCLLTDAPDSTSRKIHLFVVGDISRLFKHLSESVQFVVDTPGVIPQKILQFFGVDAVHVSGAHGFLQ